ncbi:hypothetical protein ACFLU6_14480 [Acidobacteriota bacterium]
MAELVIEHIGKKDPEEEGWAFHKAKNTDSCGGKYGPIDDSGTEAWTMDDDATCSGSAFMYERSPTEGQNKRALENGWILSVKIRIVDIPDPVDTIIAQYWHGGTHIDYVMVFGSERDGDPIVQVGKQSYAIEGAGSTYHLYELKYDPEEKSADLFIDDVERISNAAGRYRPEYPNINRIAFGSGDSKNTGHGNFALVSFEIHPGR